MDWLNYHHLLYFYTVAREGSMSRASEVLQLAQPTLSSQIAKLERSIGEQLFRRVGRRLEMTETGRTVYNYAEEIFSLGQELLQTLQGRPRDRPLRFVVGIADVVPKMIVYRLLQPVYSLLEPVHLICWEGASADMVNQLMSHQIDLVLSDEPARPAVKTRIFNHLLGECGLTVFADSTHAATLRAGFPQSLAEVPWLLPTPGTSLRRSLDQWFDSLGFLPLIRGEFADSALLKVFGHLGVGVFAMPTAIEKDLIEQYQLGVVGRISSLHERYYAISAERRLKHPAVQAISERARKELFTT